MSNVDLSPYQDQTNSAMTNFANRSAQNSFSRNAAQVSGNRNVADFRQGFRRNLPKWGAGFAQRGLSGGGIQSGVHNRAMQNFLGDYTRDMGRMQEDNFNTDQQFGFNQAQFTADRDSAMADIATRKAQMIAQTAQGIASLRPYLGG